MLDIEYEGVTFPPQMNNRNDLAHASGEPLEQGNLEFLLGIEIGEVEWDHRMGQRLREACHSKETSEIVINAVSFRDSVDLVNNYASQFRVLRSLTEINAKTVKVSIEYQRRDTLDPNNKFTAKIEVTR
jgi:hypothetical protein